MAGEHIVEMNDNDFDAKIREGNGPVLVDFWASWCPPCKQVAPLLEELADELAGRATIAKVDVDANGDLANRFGIRSIPTLVVFKDGRVVDQMIGAAPKQQILRLVEKHIG